MYNEAQGLLDSIKQVSLALVMLISVARDVGKVSLCRLYRCVSFCPPLSPAATILVCILFLGIIYCTVHCCYDIGGCCCTSEKRYEKIDAFEKTSVPPKSRHVCLCCHLDSTYCARGCGRKRIGPKDDWGCWGSKQNWVYRCSRWTRKEAIKGAGATNKKRREVQGDMQERRRQRAEKPKDLSMGES